MSPADQQYYTHLAVRLVRKAREAMTTEAYAAYVDMCAGMVSANISYFDRAAFVAFCHMADNKRR